ILIQTKEKINFPIIIDYQNFWPEELIENKIINRNSKTYNFLMSKERQIIKKADFIITPSEELKKYLIKRFKIHDDARIEKVVNGGNPILKTPLNKHFPPKIINAGMVVKRSNMQLFLNSIPYIIKKYPKAEIYITKKGEDLKKIMKLIKKMNLNSNIRFYWEDTYQEFLKFLAKCHVGVVTSTYNLTRRLGFVTKIYDYFAVGVPVVGNSVGGWTSIISEEKLGLLSSNDPHDLAEKIVKVIENDQLGKEFGKAAIEILKTKYSIKSSAKSLIKVINKCI
ncbi:MAG: glycosyltransferase family 4 protein, partial [Candidatus Thorarchaeota archaeon]